MATQQSFITTKSGALTTANTSEVIAPKNSTRQYLLIQNIDASEPLWVRFNPDQSQTAAAAQSTAGNVYIAASASLEFKEVVPINAISAIAISAGHKFTIVEGA